MSRNLPLIALLALAGVTLAVFPPVRFHSAKAMRAGRSATRAGGRVGRVTLER